MSKVFTEADFSNYLDSDLIWRRKELSDLKSAIRTADSVSKQVLLKSMVTMLYAHWEGYVRNSAKAYFDFLALRKRKYQELEAQIYINSFLARIDALSMNKSALEVKCALVADILASSKDRFSFINPTLIDTKSNLSTDVIKDICIVCAVDGAHYELKRSFIDKIILKRRNAIAHGQYEIVDEKEVDAIVSEMLGLMASFRALLENKIYTQSYLV